MPPPRRSAFDVSFPELVDDNREAQVRSRSLASGGHARKLDAKRKTANSTVDTRVSEFSFADYIDEYNYWCRHRSVTSQPPTKKMQDPSVVGEIVSRA